MGMQNAVLYLYLNKVVFINVCLKLTFQGNKLNMKNGCVSIDKLKIKELILQIPIEFTAGTSMKNAGVLLYKLLDAPPFYLLLSTANSTFQSQDFIDITDIIYNIT